MARPKGAKNKKTLATEKKIKELKEKGLDPKDYIVSCMNDPANYDEIQYRAASDLMEYYYAKKPRAMTGVFSTKPIEEMNEAELAIFLGTSA